MPETIKNKTVIIVTGPTASGKTPAAIGLARHFNTEIISADSRQCFRELKIGVARPTEEELAAVKHHFIASHSIHEEVNAGTFEKFALAKCEELFKKHDVIIMSGGTGLYIKAFCEGLDTIPEIDDVIRENIIREYEEKGLSWLQEAVEQQDPLYASTGETANPQRMMRALEVARSTGRSILSYHTTGQTRRDFNIIKIGLSVPREQLITNINQRVDNMITSGLIEEAKMLYPLKHLNALQTVGYRELFDHFDHTLSLNEAIERIKVNTRQYAKRQMTWFRKDKTIHWFPAGDVSVLIDFTRRRSD